MNTIYRLSPVTNPPYLLTSSIKKIKKLPTFDFANKTNVLASFSLSHAMTSVPCNEFQNQLSKFANRYLAEENCSQVFQNSSAIANNCFSYCSFPGKQVFTQILVKLYKILVFVLIPHEKLKQGSRLVFILFLNP